MKHFWLHHALEWMHAIQGAGGFGACLFVGLYALCCLLFIPGSILTVTAGTVYGFWTGCALVLAGNGLGSVLSLLVTRYFLRDWVRGRLENNPRLKALEKAISQDDWRLVFLTRLSPIMPYSLINYSLGLTSIPAWRFLLATELGAVPAVCLYVYIGTLMGNLALIGPELKQHRPLEWVVQGIGIALAIGVSIYVTRMATRALNQRMHSKA